MKRSKLLLSALVAGNISAAMAQPPTIRDNHFNDLDRETIFDARIKRIIAERRNQQIQLFNRTIPEKRYIVKFKDGSFATKQNAQGKMQLNSKSSVSYMKTLGVSVKDELTKARAISVTMTDKIKSQLMKNPAIEYIEEDHPRYLLAESSPWGLSQVQADLVSDNNAGNMTVCIIDSGYEIAHSDLSANNHTGTNDAGTGNWYQTGGSHGTHVAGTIAAVNNGDGVEGVLPNQNVNLHIVKVFNADGWGYSSGLVGAIDSCIDAGSNVINMSLGGPASTITESNAMQSAYDSGTLLIAAAGNAGDSTHSYPASYDSVISVAALDANNQRANFSQYTDQVEISAPGESVLSSVGIGDGRQGFITRGSSVYADDSVAPQTRFVLDASGDFVVNNINASISGVLGSCSVSSVGNYSCLNMNNRICLIERYQNQADSPGLYPDINAALACSNAGGIGVIIYSNEERTALQNPFLVDQNSQISIPTVSIDQNLGQTLLGTIGENMTLEVRGGTDYAYYNGTSMASPHIASVAALVWSQHSECTNDQIRNVLNQTALDLETAGRDNNTGYGLVQASAADNYITTLGCDGNGSGNGNPDSNILENGIAKTNLSGAQSAQSRFTFEVPVGATDLSFVLSGGTGDADLHVQFASEATLSNYDCRPWRDGNEETCNISNVQTGTYHVMLNGYRAFDGVSLTASYTAPVTTDPGGTASANNLSGNLRTWQHFTLNIPSGMSHLTVTTSDGSGDADLYLREGSQSTLTSYDALSWSDGNNEEAIIVNPQEGVVHISLYAYRAYSGVNLVAEWRP